MVLAKWYYKELLVQTKTFYPTLSSIRVNNFLYKKNIKACVIKKYLSCIGGKSIGTMPWAAIIYKHFPTAIFITSVPVQLKDKLTLGVCNFLAPCIVLKKQAVNQYHQLMTQALCLP